MKHQSIRHLAGTAVLTLLAACSSGGGGQSSNALPGHGALAITVTPNPIIATKVSGNTYDFPFSIAIREVGGAAVEIQEVSVDVTALGSLRVYSKTYDSAEIARLGYPTSIAANGEIRYSLNPRKDVSDDRLFEAVEAELTVRGVDPTGAPTTARTTVTVRR